MPIIINCRICKTVLLTVDNEKLKYIQRVTNNNKRITTFIQYIRQQIGECPNCGHIPDEKPSNIKITPYRGDQTNE